MSQSPHSFVAFIDESGDEGFQIVPPPDRKSSEWFLLSAVVFRSAEWGLQSRLIGQCLSKVKGARKVLHFSELTHEQRLPVIDCIAKSPAVVVTMCVHKAGMMDGRQHGLDAERRLYFYTTRFLLERLSWYARGNHIAGVGNGKVRLEFARAKNLSYQLMEHYLHTLRDSDVFMKNTQIAWEHVDTDNIKVDQPTTSLGLCLADATSSGIRMALELSRHGFCEPRYIEMLKPRVYCRLGNYLSYGLKFFPRVPATQAQWHDRYAWINSLFAKGK